jgi:hypothetical protein
MGLALIFVCIWAGAIALMFASDPVVRFAGKAFVLALLILAFSRSGGLGSVFAIVVIVILFIAKATQGATPAPFAGNQPPADEVEPQEESE